MLKWRSQVTNTKLRAFAEQLMSDIRELEYDGQLPRRTVFDQLLLTAHERGHQVMARPRLPGQRDDPVSVVTWLSTARSPDEADSPRAARGITSQQRTAARWMCVFGRRG